MRRIGEDGRLYVVDGHLRVEMAGDAPIQVAVTDLTEAEARYVLATHDPITSMANTDVEALRQLLDEVDVEDPALRQLLRDEADLAGIQWANGVASPSAAVKAQIVIDCPPEDLDAVLDAVRAALADDYGDRVSMTAKGRPE